jgi:transcriptional regulator with XRE-family HTH domain
MNPLNQTLFEFRRHKNMTFRVFSKEIGIDHSIISKIEKNKISVSFRTLEKYCKYFNVFTSDIFLCCEKKTPFEIREAVNKLLNKKGLTL